jgi:hypothetical protein
VCVTSDRAREVNDDYFCPAGAAAFCGWPVRIALMVSDPNPIPTRVHHCPPVACPAVVTASVASGTARDAPN